MSRLNLPYLAATALCCLFALTTTAQVIPDSVTIIRDTYGVPHIYGPTDADVAYGLAWANAEDDFPNMQLNMLMARARLAEVKGKDGAGIDYAVQLLEIRKMITQRYPTEVSPAFKKVLEGYAQGINAYAASHPKEVLRPRLFPLDPIDILCGYSMSLVLLQGAAWDFQAILQGRPGAPGPYSMRGSNGFAFSSRRTADGQTYLVNNSHQPLDGPTAWYEAHLVSGEGQNVLGGLFPGGVSVFAGATPDLAWMHTVNTPDLTDVYKLTVRGKGKKLEYKMDGQWKPLSQSKAKMKVKLGPIRLKVGKKTYKSEHGAVLKGKDDHYYAIRFPAVMTIGAAEQWHTMGKAKNFTQFRKTLDMRGLPSLNIIYADKADTIFYISNGLFPVRAPGYNYLGVLPGDTSAPLWTKFRPLDDAIQTLCPSSGYVFNTNNTPLTCTADADNPDRMSCDTLLGEYMLENNRSLRFQELMATHPTVTFDQLRAIKYDITYPDSMYIFFLQNPMLLGGLDPAQFPDIAEEIKLLENWNRNTNKESIEAGLFLVSFSWLIDKARTEHWVFERRTVPPALYAEAIRHAKKHLKKHFGSDRVPLGEIQRHVRGDQDWPIDGMPDVLAANTTAPWKKGRRRSYTGDSYIQFVRFTKTGVELETAQPYGSSNRPDSPHYADQVPLFLSQKTKPMRLDKAWVLDHAERTYHPGQ